MAIRIMKRHIGILAAAAMLALGMAVFAFAAGSFRFFGPLRRVFSPNGDGRNDTAVFCFDNPENLAVSGSIHTLLGSEVTGLGAQTTATLGVNPATTGCAPGVLGKSYYMTWDGRAEGSVVRSGVYIYKLRAEGTTFTGSLLVVR